MKHFQYSTLFRPQELYSEDLNVYQGTLLPLESVRYFKSIKVMKYIFPCSCLSIPTEDMCLIVLESYWNQRSYG